MGRSTRRGHRLATWLVLAALLGGAAACGDDGNGGAEDPNDRLIGIYSATVTAVAEEATTLPSEGDPQMTVFVQAREDSDISADVQVGVVTDLEDWANVRFIDSVEEAVDTDSEDAPVRDDGILIGLGPVPDGVSAVVVTADLYLGPERTKVFDVDLVKRIGEWQVKEPLEGVVVPTP